jgi:hypothetical protein
MNPSGWGRSAAGVGTGAAFFFIEFIGSFAELGGLGALHVEGWAVFNLFDRSRRVRVDMAAHYLYFHFLLHNPVILRKQNKVSLYYNTKQFGISSFLEP